MATIDVIHSGDFFFFDQADAHELGKLLTQRYRSGIPFPHLVIDDFLPRILIDRISDTFPDSDTSSVYHHKTHQLLKRGYRPDNLGASPCRYCLYLFNTQPFLLFLESITGINGLIPDPYFLGGGLHETEKGGKLAIHADFNFHRKLNLVRRVNVIIFLNRSWEKDFGGELELWDQNMKKCIKSIEPLYNRCVIFNTDKNSFHGHPSPLSCPENVTRKSIALYYYLAPGKSKLGSGLSEKTDWQVRPGSNDRIEETQGLLFKRITRKIGKKYWKRIKPL